MNHMQALQTAEEQSKRANAELAKIVRSNTTKLERDLKNQTVGVLRGFQKSLGSTLRQEFTTHQKTLASKDTLITVLSILAIISLMTMILTTIQNRPAPSNATPSVLTNYQTQIYQGHTYAIVPANNILKTRDGQYMVRVR